MSGERRIASNASDEELAALALKGSADAWSEIARRHTHRVVVSLLSRGVPLEVAEDLSQEVWIRLIGRQREGRLRELRLPGLAIAQAAWLAREAGRMQRRHDAILGPARAPRTAGEIDEVQALDAGPEQLAIDRERLEIVTAELSRCPARARQVFHAVYGPAGGSHADVARTLGLSIQRVRQILCEVRGRLRRALESKGGPLEHLSREAIEAMVMNVPAPGVAEARRHLSRCASCASRLEREAQLEMLLHSAAESAGDVTATPESPWWLARPWIVQAAALVILAGGALWLGHARHLAAPPAQTPQPGQQGRVSPAREFTAPGSDVESPRDFGMRTEPYVPCLEPGATTRPHASDSL